jgi:hypothetical protein
MRTRTETYIGRDQADAERRFRTDAASAARRGWYPIERQWTGRELRVTYGNTTEARWRSASDAHRHSTRRTYLVALLLVATLAVLVSSTVHLAVHGHLVG